MSIRKRTWQGPDGLSREAWVVDYKDQNSRRRQRTFGSRREARRWWETEGAPQVHAGTHVPDSASITIAEAGKVWLRACEAASLEWSTRAQYRMHLSLHIEPFLGSTKLSRLTVPAVRKWQTDLRAAGRSETMIQYATRSLGSLIGEAQEQGLATHNVVRELRRSRQAGIAPRYKKRLCVGDDIPSPEEIRALLAHSAGYYRPHLITLVFTGMRISELLGLPWRDVDLARARVRITQRADRQGRLGAPKSASGRREIPLPPIAVNTLREWEGRCPASKAGLVFPRRDGEVENYKAVIRNGLWPPQLAAGLMKRDSFSPKYPGLHALRHFYASWCINRKADGGLELPPKAVQERLGHASITMTMDVYGHLFPGQDESEALRAAELALLGPHAT